MSMFNEKVDNHEISVAVSRGNLVKIRVINNKKVDEIYLARDKALQLSDAIILISKKIKG